MCQKPKKNAEADSTLATNDFMPATAKKQKRRSVAGLAKVSFFSILLDHSLKLVVFQKLYLHVGILIVFSFSPADIYCTLIHLYILDLNVWSDCLCNNCRSANMIAPNC